MTYRKDFWDTAKVPLRAAGVSYLGGVVAGVIAGLLDNSPITRQPWAYSTVDLLSHNLFLLALLVAGSATFGLTSLGLLLANGQVLGATLVAGVRLHGGVDVALAIVPHAVLEVPAALLSGAGGFVLAWHLWRSATDQRPRWRTSLSTVAALSLMATILTTLAAPVEVHVSKHLS